MARRVDPRRLQRPDSPPLDDTPDPGTQTVSQAPPYGHVDFETRDTGSGLQRHARQLRTWANVLFAGSIVGGVIAVVAGVDMVSSSRDSYDTASLVGSAVLVGGVAGVGWSLWLRCLHGAAAQALETADRALTLLERQTALLGMVTRHLAGPDGQE